MPADVKLPAEAVLVDPEAAQALVGLHGRAQAFTHACKHIRNHHIQTRNTPGGNACYWRKNMSRCLVPRDALEERFQRGNAFTGARIGPEFWCLATLLKSVSAREHVYSARQRVLH